jgi:DNA-binding NarL/FixJ family response regulator
LRVVIAEDSVLLREGLTRLLEEAGVEVAATAGDAEAFLRAVDANIPDAVVVDVRMPPTFSDEGLRAALVVRKRWPSVGVLVLSQYVEARYATELLSVRTNGGVGYLLKDRVAEVAECVEALQRVAQGGSAIDPEVVAQLLTRKADPLGSLTAREREVLALMAEGRSNPAIASALVVGPACSPPAGAGRLSLACHLCWPLSATAALISSPWLARTATGSSRPWRQ